MRRGRDANRAGRRAARVALAGALLLVALVALGGAALLAWRVPIAAWAIGRWLAQQGVTEATFAVARVDPRGVALRAIAIGPPAAPDLAVDAAEADWSLAGLARARFDAVRASGVRLRAAVGEDGVDFGALDPLLADGGEPGPLLPAPAIELSDVDVRVDTPQGPIAGAGQLALREEDGRLAGEATLALRDAREPPRVSPVTLAAEVAGPPDALDVRATASGADGRVQARAEGRVDVVAGRGALAWRLAPVALAPDGLTPAALAPVLAALPLRDVRARVEARGEARLDADGFAYAFDVAVRDASFTSGPARVEGFHAALAFRGPPLHMPASQPVAIALVDVGIPLTDGLLELRARADGRVALRRALWHWAGGELGAGETVLDPRAVRGAIDLDVRRLDLAELLALVRLEGLSGSGRVEGSVPLALEADTVRVRDGVLRAAAGGGTLRYVPGARARALAASRPHDLGLAIDAFSDFRYESLEVRLDGDLRGDVTLGLHVRGSNPGFQDGRPIELNLTLEARLADLVRAGLASYRVPEIVEERLRAVSGGER